MNHKAFLTILLIALLQVFGAASGNNTNVNSSVISGHNDSRKLEKAYKALSRANWPMPGDLPVLKQHDSSEHVIKLKKYLRATGDLAHGRKSYIASPVFDARLTEAVKNFQSRHGLEPDGIAGRNTLEKMNVPLSFRLSQLKANIARLRELPEKFGDRYIIVNIPAFTMGYYDNGEQVITMNVIVGNIENFTPVLQDTISYIVFNPSWNVPASIVTKELIPEIIADPGYLEKNDYVLLKGAYNSKDTIDPATVDWSSVDPEKPPFSVVQKPGKKNALGKIKFMFPNNYDIYLHDTPAGQAFRLERRDFSHGCIRLEKPQELAEIMLEGQPEHDLIPEILKNEETTTVKLDNKVAVYLLYQTAWVDEKGRLQFRDDIYGLDQPAVQMY